MEISEKFNPEKFLSEITIGPYKIKKHQVEDFCQVSGEQTINVKGTDSVAAPPTFINSLPIQHYTPTQLSGKNFNRLLGGQSIECKDYIFPGDEITIKSRGIQIYEKTGRSGHMIFAVFECRYFNQNRRLVSKRLDTFIWKKLNG